MINIHLIIKIIIFYFNVNN